MNLKQDKKTSISTLGEFGLIDHLTRDIKLIHKTTITGVGDDSAVLSFPEDEIVVTTDLLLEGVHFNLVYVPLQHLGYKSVVVNLSDICAMNGQPQQITVSLGISSKFSLEDIELLYKGISHACKTYGVDLVGGDTSSSMTGLTISITAIGKVKKDTIVYSSKARKQRLEKTIKYANNPSGFLLELGCGFGYTVKYLKKVTILRPPGIAIFKYSLFRRSAFISLTK